MQILINEKLSDERLFLDVNIKSKKETTNQYISQKEKEKKKGIIDTKKTEERKKIRMFSFFFGYQYYIFNVLSVLAIFMIINVLVYFQTSTPSNQIVRSVDIVTLGVKNWLN